ncbi:hypothetical protein SAY86_022353 [Trapa natans]|uniref:Uncharacterized protein n=1 Tax=Trapa natans TaxID=22666 RepID=A0AAN7M5E1_TRANT|nr:hypothetical protein SAY86_022353 [Trapa natans]
MMSGAIDQQPLIGDFYSTQEGRPAETDQEDDQANATCIESLSALSFHSNLGCLSSPAADSLTNIAKTCSGTKRSLPFTAPGSGAAAIPATTNARTSKKQLPIDIDLALSGFSKISLPPYHLEGMAVPVSSSNPRTPSPVKGSISKLVPQTLAPAPSSLPPLPLRRTISDPTPASVYKVDENLNSQKRLKMMSRQLKEMSECWDRVLREQEEEEACRDQINNATKDDEGGGEDENKELVSVEVVGKCLSLNFSCQCGKGYQILLSGRNCYYKLV